MTVSDAQLARWLRDDNADRIVLAELEFAYESGGSIAEGKVYLAAGHYATGTQPYRDVIQNGPEFERSIDLERLGGRARRSAGSITLGNLDGRLDYLLDVIADGREVAFFIGDRGWAREDFRPLMVGTVWEISAPSEGEIAIELRDTRFPLDDAIVGDPITTGPNVGRRKPIVLGEVRNFDITPYLFDTGALKYYINDFPLMAGIDSRVSGVRDAGASLLEPVLFSFQSLNMTANAGTNTLTKTTPHSLSVNDVLVFEEFGGGSLFTGLSGFTQYWVIAAGLTANDFRLSLTKGGAAVDITGTSMTGSWDARRQRYYIDSAAATIELSAEPEGRVTLDMRAVDTSGDLIDAEPHAVFKFLLEHYSTLSPAQYDEAAIDALAALEDAEGLVYGRAIPDRDNLMALLDEIALVSCSWYAPNSNGVLTVGRLDLANLDAATAVDMIDERDLMEPMSARNQPLQRGRVILDTDRNVVTQGDGLVANVTPESRALWTQQHQVRVTSTDPGTTGYLANWWDYHATAIDSKPIATNLAQGGLGGAQLVADAMLELFRPWTRVHTCTLGIDKYALNPGDCVRVTYPRFGLQDGKNCRVVSVKVRPLDALCDLVLVRRAQPDYTTAAH